MLLKPENRIAISRCFFVSILASFDFFYVREKQFKLKRNNDRSNWLPKNFKKNYQVFCRILLVVFTLRNTYFLNKQWNIELCGFSSFVIKF